MRITQRRKNSHSLTEACCSKMLTRPVGKITKCRSCIFWMLLVAAGVICTSYIGLICASYRQVLKVNDGFSQQEQEQLPNNNSAHLEKNKANDALPTSLRIKPKSTTENNRGVVVIDPPRQAAPTLTTPVSAPYEYVYKTQFLKKDMSTPWPNWTKCNMTAAFEATCHPRSATCINVNDEVFSSHGIGNALITTYSIAARESLREKPDCAPILQDKNKYASSSSSSWYFRLLDYVQEPHEVVKAVENQKCVLHSITRPREAVAAKVRQVASQFRTENETSPSLPLVALQIRTGWADELNTNAAGWESLGNCDDYPRDINNTPLSVNELDLNGMLLDTARTADTIFGTRNWRLYVASDAPGVREYARHLLRERTPAIVWNDGPVGFNKGGYGISLTAFTDIFVMSEADLLVSTSSKFARVGGMIGMCPKREIVLNGYYPRHGLATNGGLLTRGWKKRAEFADEGMMQQFWDNLPQGRDNPCAKAADPLRSCYCMLKHGHQ